jgi:hypothetical protein
LRDLPRRASGSAAKSQSEISSAPFTRPNVGDEVTFTFAPGSGRAVGIALADEADRLEFYLRYERFSITDMNEAEDVFTARITGSASDGYVSNFGNNFKLPVH